MALRLESMKPNYDISDKNIDPEVFDFVRKNVPILPYPRAEESINDYSFSQLNQS